MTFIVWLGFGRKVEEKRGIGKNNLRKDYQYQNINDLRCVSGRIVCDTVGEKHAVEFLYQFGPQWHAGKMLVLRFLNHLP